MEEHSLDDIFRDNLYSHVSPVPTGMWEKIAENKPKRRRLVPYWPAASLLLLGLSIGYYFVNRLKSTNNSFKNSNVKQQVSVGGKNGIVSIKENKTQDGLIDLNQKRGQLQHWGGQDNEAERLLANEPERGGLAKAGESNTGKGLASPSNKGEMQSTSSSADINLNKNKANNPTALENSETSDKRVYGKGRSLDRHPKKIVVESIPFRGDENLSNPPYFSRKGSLLTNTIPTVPYGSQGEKNKMDGFDNLTTNWKQSEKAQTYIKANILDSSFDFNKLLPKAKDALDKPLAHIDTKKKRKSLWYIEGYSSANMDRQSFVSNGATKQFLQSKDSSEKMLVGGSIGLRLTRTFGKHFSVKAGVQISQSNQLFKLRTDNVTKTTSTIVQGAYIDPSGNTIIYSDTTTYIQKGVYVNSYYNTYKNIELPLLVTYDINWRSWQFSLGLGTAINLSTIFNGETLGTNGQIVPLSAKIAGGAYSSSIQYSLLGNISITKNLSQSLALFAEPYYKTNLEGTNSYQFGFARKQQTLGCNLGIRLFFGTTR